VFCGYFTSYGYVGKVQNATMLFASEQDYLEYMESSEEPSLESKTQNV